MLISVHFGYIYSQKHITSRVQWQQVHKQHPHTHFCFFIFFFLTHPLKLYNFCSPSLSPQPKCKRYNASPLRFICHLSYLIFLFFFFFFHFSLFYFFFFSLFLYLSLSGLFGVYWRNVSSKTPPPIVLWVCTY